MTAIWHIDLRTKYVRKSLSIGKCTSMTLKIGFVKIEMRRKMRV